MTGTKSSWVHRSGGLEITVSGGDLHVRKMLSATQLDTARVDAVEMMWEHIVEREIADLLEREIRDR